MQALCVNEKLMLEYSEIPTPEIGEDEVLVRIKAAALNHRDLNMLSFYEQMKTKNPDFPFATYVVGSDGAGVIEAAGKNVTGWKAGDEVFFSSMTYCGTCEACLAGDGAACSKSSILGSSFVDGTLAEYVKVRADLLIKKPSHLTFEEAAAMPMALGTAWRAILTKGNLQSGETVLIQGIGGGVALFALQIASKMGASVIVTSSSDEKLAQAKQLGAAEGVNYREDDVVARTKALTDGQGVHLVLDGGGAETMPAAVQAVRNRGRIVNYGFVTGRNFTLDTYHLFIRQVQIIGTAMHSFAELEAAVEFYNLNELHPVISSVKSFSETIVALDILRQGGQFGKLVISLGPN